MKSPSRHTTLEQRRFNVDSTSRPTLTLFHHCVPAGSVINLSKCCGLYSDVDTHLLVPPNPPNPVFICRLCTDYYRAGSKGDSWGSFDPHLTQNFILHQTVWTNMINCGFCIYSKYLHFTLCIIFLLKIQEVSFTTSECLDCYMYSKQCRSWSDAAWRGVWSGSTLFAHACFPFI